MEHGTAPGSLPGLSPASPDGTLLLYVPVGLYRDGEGRLTFEAQACNGLARWADHFARLILVAPEVPGAPPKGWRPLDTLDPALRARIDLRPVPATPRPLGFARALPASRHRLRAAIAEADYLCLAIGGLIGDWGAVAALTAHRMGKPYAVWTDRVESEVIRAGITHPRWRARWFARLTHRPTAWLERAVIRRAALGLFHGRETWEAFAPLCGGPSEIVHDIHLPAQDAIPPEALAAKRAAITAGAPLQIAYAGRADPLKGALDWLAVLERLAAQGVEFRARWFGEGPDLEAMRARIEAAGLADRIALPGFTADRAALLKALRETHIFLFCHKTRESPRCLIEALISGAPIVGYDGAYPRDLVSAHQGGRFVPRGDIPALADLVATLEADRPALDALVSAAAADGAPFNDAAVFAHRSTLIRQHLPAGAS